MKIREYLERKYHLKRPTTITYQECRGFGMQWPPKNGWIDREGSWTITSQMARDALKYMRRKGSKGNESRKEYRRIGIELLQDYLDRNLAPDAAGKPAPKIWPQMRKAKPQPQQPDVNFYESREWRELRYRALVLHGGACQCCGATAKDGVRLHVDHIKPRSLWPSLELQITNLQVLCESCNLGKSNKDATDWRPAEFAND